MGLKKRILKVTLSMPGGDVVLDAGLRLRIRIHKAALALQNSAYIEVTNLTTTMRETLLSQFTAFQRNLVQQGQVTSAYQWINVTIEAGYQTGTDINTSVVFKGQVVQVDPAIGPPNIGVRIKCFTRQIDKTTFVSSPAPAQATFKDYVTWAATEMGYGDNFICDTSFNDMLITNPSRNTITHSGLLLDIQSIYRPDVAAFVDDDFLYVKDRNKIVNTDAIAQLSEFIDTPLWTEWGVDFKLLFDQSVRLAQGATLTSTMNPSLNGTYIVLQLDYELDSREGPFYVTAGGSPPA